MALVRVASFSLSLDGFGAGPGQSLEHPLGIGGPSLHEWALTTRTFHREVLHDDGGVDGVDNDFATRGFRNIGAWILGRNMFSPQRGPWLDDSWKGWWGDEPPYHVPVFVLTHHPRASFEMQGGTTFHFVMDGMRAALERALAAAGGKDVRIGGGVSTIRQYLQAQLIDELHVAVAPVLLGAGEHLWAGMNLPALGYRVTERVATPLATHVVISRT